MVGLIHNDGGLITEPFHIASCFNDHFYAVFCVDDGTSPIFASIESASSLADLVLSQGDILSVLNLNKKKAIGPDNIPT